MKAGTILKTAGLAAALSLPTAANAAFFLDVNGAAPGGKVVRNILDWFPDNGLLDGAIPIPATPGTVDFDYRVQATLNDTALAAGTEITMQAVIPMTATVLASGGGISFAVDGIRAGGTFDIYFDAAANASDVTGAGYDDGVNILKGDILASLANEEGTVVLGSTVVGLLDQFGVDNQGGTTTVGVSGNLPVVKVEIDTFDLDYFPADPNGDTIDVSPIAGEIDFTSTFDNLAAFLNANPSDEVVGATPDYGTDGVNDNTCGTATSCDLQVETDGRSPFRAELAVPEPAGLALFGMGLLAMGAARLRRSR